MLIGILSDSHDQVDITRRAIQMLIDRGAEYLIHCGDLCVEPILDLLAGETPAAFVFGNNDVNHHALARYANNLGIKCLAEFGELEFGDKRIAVTHGHRSALMSRAMRDENIDYLFVGHTHVAIDMRSKNVRVINPGALHRASRYSIALLDTETDKLEKIELARSES